MSDIGRIVVLYHKYVGSGEVDLNRLFECVKRETAAAEKKKIKTSTELLTELRADRAFIGKMAKVY